jgi:YVTN family beta-propeller protein
VANLAQFRRLTAIALPHAPNHLAYSRDRVFVTSREGAELIEIAPARFAVARRLSLPGKPVWFRPLPAGDAGILLIDDPPAVLRVDLSPGKLRVAGRLALNAAPAAAEINGSTLALTLPAAKSVQRVTIPDLKPAGSTGVGVACETIAFRPDGKTILAGSASEREVIALETDSGALLVRLPVPVAPSRFCFNADGGQMFVSGTGGDVVAIVSPYQNEVGETMLAGKTPGAMVVSPTQNLLFVANPASGDLTILDIDTRHLSASVHVGGNPAEVLITPEGEYALVVDSQSGTVSVVRIPTVLDHKVKTKPLFTVFPTASDIRSAIIVPFSHDFES